MNVWRKTRRNETSVTLKWNGNEFHTRKGWEKVRKLIDERNAFMLFLSYPRRPTLWRAKNCRAYNWMKINWNVANSRWIRTEFDLSFFNMTFIIHSIHFLPFRLGMCEAMANGVDAIACHRLTHDCCRTHVLQFWCSIRWIWFKKCLCWLKCPFFSPSSLCETRHMFMLYRSTRATLCMDGRVWSLSLTQFSVIK